MTKEIDYRDDCRAFCSTNDNRFQCWRARSMLHQIQQGGLTEENQNEYIAREIKRINVQNCLRPEIPARVVQQVIFKDRILPENVEEAIIDLDSSFNGELDIYLIEETEA